jgi:phosphoglycolate phosphatase-like HAD superfamily hydrolase
MHVCLFDIDGTLLNTGGAGQAAMEAALASEFGTTKPLDRSVTFSGRTDRAIMADLFAYYAIENTEETLARFIAAYLRHLPETLAAREGLVLPGITALLDALCTREDVLLGLLTGNYRHGAKIKLGHYQLDHHFGFGGYGDHHLDRDDVARDALQEVHSRLNGSVDLERVWVIGDTPSDVRCARAIGAKVVAVATGIYGADELKAQRPDHLVPDFTDAACLLSLLC